MDEMQFLLPQGAELLLDELELPTVHCAPPELEEDDDEELDELEEFDTVHVPCAY